MPIDRAEAERRARIYADCCSPNTSVVLIPVARIPAEMPYGWWFQYQSKRYVETGDHRRMLLGPGPFVINRQTGNVWTAGSSWGMDETVAAYEASLFDGRSRMEDEQEFDGDRLLEREPWPFKDWSHVDSLDKALDLHRAGTLDKVLLVPSELGGPTRRRTRSMSRTSPQPTSASPTIGSPT